MYLGCFTRWPLRPVPVQCLCREWPGLWPVFSGEQWVQAGGSQPEAGNSASPGVMPISWRSLFPSSSSPRGKAKGSLGQVVSLCPEGCFATKPSFPSTVNTRMENRDTHPKKEREESQSEIAALQQGCWCYTARDVLRPVLADV